MQEEWIAAFSAIAVAFVGLAGVIVQGSRSNKKSHDDVLDILSELCEKVGGVLEWQDAHGQVHRVMAEQAEEIKREIGRVATRTMSREEVRALAHQLLTEAEYRAAIKRAQEAVDSGK